MSTRPDTQGPAPRSRGVSASEVEALANKLVALVEEFEAELSEGHVPRAFAERLAQLRKTAERLF